MHDKMSQCGMVIYTNDIGMMSYAGNICDLFWQNEHNEDSIITFGDNCISTTIEYGMLWDRRLWATKWNILDEIFFVFFHSVACIIGCVWEQLSQDKVWNLKKLKSLRAQILLQFLFNYCLILNKLLGPRDDFTNTVTYDRS